MVHIINIAPENKPLLGFIFPDYGFVDSFLSTSKFIIEYDVTSLKLKESIMYNYSDCIVISTVLYDELWDESKLSELVVEFAHNTLKSRRKVIPRNSDFVTDCVNFIFGLDCEEISSEITPLFDSFGSSTFVQKFLEISDKIPISVLCSSMDTFIYKILSASDSSVYYKKKSMQYRDKIRKNFTSSYDNYLNSSDDEFGFKRIKFYTQLWS